MPTRFVPSVCLWLALAAGPHLFAQAADLPIDLLIDLPDAPVPVESGADVAQSATNRPYAKFILPGEPAPRLGFRGKFVFGVRDAASIASGVAWIVNAGFVQLTNGKPHYGTNSSAFAERFGAAALRDTSEDVFSESLVAPLVRQDPRYYILGPHHSAIHRILYAASRTLITRTDNGGRSVNLWMLGGDLAGATLTNAYYPPADHGVKPTAQIFAGSLGGSALDFIFSEFFSSVYDLVHSKSASQ